MIMEEKELREKYKGVISLLTDKNITVSAMESCTGGLVASLLTDIPGASEVFKGGIVAYCNEAKIRYGVPEEVIGTYGVYSAQCAAAMAEAAASEFGTALGIGITGSLCTVDKNNSGSVPGTVYAAAAVKGSDPAAAVINADETERYLCKMLVASAVADMITDVCEIYG